VEAEFRWDDPEAPATDYDRAADVKDYLAVLEVGDGEGLVLNGSPMSTSWRPDADRRGGLFARWVCADNDAIVEASLKRVPPDLWGPPWVEFTVDDPVLYLFDSAYAGSDVAAQREGAEPLLLRLEPGVYLVSTGYYQPDDSTELVLHRLSLRG
jgi:hypothetical protein